MNQTHHHQTGSQNSTHEAHHGQTHARISRRQGWIGRRWIRVAAGALAASLAFGLASGTASANTTSTSGSAGVVIPVQVTGRLVPTGSSWLQQKGLYIQPSTIYRSPATSGVQYVQYVVVIEQWISGRWQATQTPLNHTYTISAGTQAIKTYAASAPVTGFSRVKYGISWVDANNRLLGSRAVNMFHRSDYICSPTVFCSTGPGYIYLG